MVTAPVNNYSKIEGEGDKNINQFYRLFVIGKKSLPEIRKSEARWSNATGLE